MQFRVATLRGASVACLGLAALLTAALAWPSSRTRVDIFLAGEQIQSGWVTLSSGRAPESPSVPDLGLGIDLPDSMLLGRPERLALTVGLTAEVPPPEVYSVSVETLSLETEITPPGEMGQALRNGTTFAWEMAARHAPQVSATLLVRLRRHSAEGGTEAERLVLARDLDLPVRTVAGLSAPAARRAAAILGLAGALSGIAAALTRRR
jgi:hypothetical protein